jgi:hypothetical protein
MKGNWFKRHLNWTWVAIWILVVAAAYSVLVYVYDLPAPMRTVTIADNITLRLQKPGVSGYTEEVHPFNRYELEPDYRAKDIWVDNALVYWWWPVYIIGNIIGGRWMLKQKRRSLHWLWLTPLFPITLLIIDKRLPSVIEEKDDGK